MTSTYKSIIDLMQEEVKPEIIFLQSRPSRSHKTECCHRNPPLSPFIKEYSEITSYLRVTFTSVTFLMSISPLPPQIFFPALYPSIQTHILSLSIYINLCEGFLDLNWVGGGGTRE